MNDYTKEDFQGRGGNYPKSGVPVSIQHNVDGKEMTIEFKNTTEKQASAYMERYCEKNDIIFNKMTAYQSGDYENDWVEVSVKGVEGKKEKLKEMVQESKPIVEKEIKVEEVEVKEEDLSTKLKKSIDAEFDTLASKIDDPDIQNKIKQFLDFQSQFHNYSLNNKMLIFSQCSDRNLSPEKFASFQKWSELGATVGKDEKGIKILVPVLKNYPQDTFKSQDDIHTYLQKRCGEQKINTIFNKFTINDFKNNVFSKDMLDNFIDMYNLQRIKNVSKDIGLKVAQKLYPQTKNVDNVILESADKTITKQYQHFKVGNVFDVNQTNAKEIGAYKSLEYRDNNDISTEMLNEMVERVMTKYDINVSFEPIRNGSKGYYDLIDHRIAIKEDMSASNQLQTLFHELGHSIMHKDLDYDEIQSIGKIEGQAEAFCYLMSRQVGLNPSSELYISSWGNDGKSLKEQMFLITDTVKVAIGTLGLENGFELTYNNTNDNIKDNKHINTHRK